jgi:hypothetical protein
MYKTGNSLSLGHMLWWLLGDPRWRKSWFTSGRMKIQKQEDH